MRTKNSRRGAPSLILVPRPSARDTPSLGNFHSKPFFHTWPIRELRRNAARHSVARRLAMSVHAPELVLPPKLGALVDSWLEEDIPWFDVGAQLVGSAQQPPVLAGRP